MQGVDRFRVRNVNGTFDRFDAGEDGGVETVLYRVREGDDLHSIAARFYGREDFWVFIFVANPGEIHGVSELAPGKLLRVPMLPAWGNDVPPSS